MDKKDIENFYNQYKKSISTITKLERRLLKESYSYKKWSVTLREKSRIIRKLYIENDKQCADIIGEITSHPEMLTEEIADTFMTHIVFFIAEGYKDYEVVVPVIEVLITYYENKNDKGHLLDCYYYMARAILEQRRYKQAEMYYTKAVEIFDDPTECSESYRIYRIMCSHYFRLLAAVCETVPNQTKIAQYIKQTIDIWTVNTPVDFLNEKKRQSIICIARSLAAYTLIRVLRTDAFINEELFKYVEDEFEYERHQCGSSNAIDSRIFITYYKCLTRYNKLSEEEYRRKMISKYQMESYNNRAKFDYGEWDFGQLFYHDIAEDIFEKDKILYMNHSYTYIYCLIPELIDWITNIEFRKELLREVHRYYSELPVISGDFLIDRSIEGNLKKIFKNANNINSVLDMIENIYVYRQVTTVIHSVMVSRLAELMTQHFIESAPEIFVGQCGTRTIEDVKNKGDKIIEFAITAGKCHDLGKIICSDIINLQTRKITGPEFEIIQNHPRKGAEIIDNIDVFSEYRDIAYGHHKSFDGKSGYPKEFDNTKSPVKIFIDIISICDCIDAATDVLGRNYTKAKDFYVVLEELEEGRGTRYSDVIVDLIKNDSELIKRIHEMTLLEREMTYYEVYRTFIEPDVRFRPNDEKYIRICNDSDIQIISEFSTESEDELLKKLTECDGLSYVMVDGYGRIYGYIFGNGTIKDGLLKILSIYVDSDYRRNGYGTHLLDHLEKMAHPEGYKKMIVSADEDGHFDKFCWRNGFTRNENDEIMIKQI